MTHVGMVVTEYKIGNAEIRVYRPVLSDEEREKREQAMRLVLQQIGKSMVEKRRDTNDNND